MNVGVKEFFGSQAWEFFLWWFVGSVNFGVKQFFGSQAWDFSPLVAY